ncbi:MAG: FliM/FliN family flagellar motor switch protein [Woeseiaceae bacterium]|nr:FliM/FliN family flagellar motor switch protein [Woeseiaceae bacterium]
MNDQVLTDEEKDALVEGVENGAVEVQTGNGPRYASVTEFEISPRNRIVTNSYPRLQNLNRKLAGLMTKSVSVLLNDKVEVSNGPLLTCTWAEFVETATEAALIVECSVQPLEGSAAVHMQAGAVRHVVETFFGGSPENPPRHQIDGFTRGEMNVVRLFSEEVLKGIADTWKTLIALDTKVSGVHPNTDVVEVIEPGASVISSEFSLHIGEDEHRFHVAWPLATLSSLLPVLEGAKRERDAAEDSRWEKVIRARVPEASVDVSSRIGHARMSLRDVAALKAGDIIDIENPRVGTVYAKDVAVLEGRFGVHDGCYAIEATRWLTEVANAESFAT